MKLCYNRSNKDAIVLWLVHLDIVKKNIAYYQSISWLLGTEDITRKTWKSNRRPAIGKCQLYFLETGSNTDICKFTWSLFPAEFWVATLNIVLQLYTRAYCSLQDVSFFFQKWLKISDLVVEQLKPNLQFLSYLCFIYFFMLKCASFKLRSWNF